MWVGVYLALARGVVDAEARQVGLGGGGGAGDAAQLAHGGAGGGRLLEVHERRARRAVHAHRRGLAATRHRAQHLHTTHHRREARTRTTYFALCMPTRRHYLFTLHALRLKTRAQKFNLWLDFLRKSARITGFCFYFLWYGNLSVVQK